MAPLIDTIASNLEPGGRLLVKDIEPSPAYKLGFTWALDKLMDYKAPVRYWAPEEIQPLIERAGFVVHRHRMIDYLPYPHILYVSTRLKGGTALGPLSERASEPTLRFAPCRLNARRPVRRSFSGPGSRANLASARCTSAHAERSSADASGARESVSGSPRGEAPRVR